MKESNRWRVRFENIDRVVLWIILGLMGFGLVQVYSSSYILAIDEFANGLFYVRKQVLFTLVGLLSIGVLVFLKTSHLMKLGQWLYYPCVFVLLLTLIPGVGVKVGGASRWLPLFGSFRVEPSEFIKVLILFPLSAWLACVQDSSIPFKVKGMQILGLAGPLLIFIFQPDYGSFVLCSWVVLILLFIFFRPLWPVFAAVGGFGIISLALLFSEPYRVKRIQTYLDPWTDPKGAGFQVIQSLLSFRSGGFWGRGLGESQGKLYFLPEAHTDFTLAILGEEWGFFGFFVFMMLILTLIIKGLKITMDQEDLRRRILSFGLITLFTYSVFFNVCVVLGLLPTKGLSLPFMSYGGSSLIATCLLFGTLLNLSAKK